LMQTNINVQALTVEAILTGNREPIYHAAMLDPHTGAELDLDQIWQLVDDLIAQHAEWIPHQFRNVETTTGQAQEPPAAVTVG
jgi:alpha-galactosidase